MPEPGAGPPESTGSSATDSHLDYKALYMALQQETSAKIEALELAHRSLQDRYANLADAHTAAGQEIARLSQKLQEHEVTKLRWERILKMPSSWAA
jgi:chromosome segregation ATPase